jgi:hypothetical protein
MLRVQQRMVIGPWSRRTVELFGDRESVGGVIQGAGKEEEKLSKNKSSRASGDVH